MPESPLAPRVPERLTGRRVASTSPSDVPVGDGGFILIEALVSMIIFAIIATGAGAAIIGGLSATTVTNARVATANVAQQAIQQAQNQSAATLAAQPTTTSTVTAGSASYTVTRTITYSPTSSTGCPAAIESGTPHAMVVHVTVTGTGTVSRTVSMDTVIAC